MTHAQDTAGVIAALQHPACCAIVCAACPSLLHACSCDLLLEPLCKSEMFVGHLLSTPLSYHVCEAEIS